MTTSLAPPFPQFFDEDGAALDGGFIYMGTANADPVANPIAVFFDAGCTVSASQPLRTSGGFIVDGSGTPQNVYVAGATDFSVAVKDSTNTPIYAAPSYTARLLSSAITFGELGVGTSILPDAAGGAFSGSVALPWSSTVTRALQAKTATVYNAAQPSAPADLAALNQRTQLLLVGGQLDADATPTWSNTYNLDTTSSTRVSIGRYRIFPTVPFPSTAYRVLVTLTTDPGNVSVDIATAAKGLTFFEVFIRLDKTLADFSFDFVVVGNSAVADPIS
jgi:hypothetical protein